MTSTNGSRSNSRHMTIAIMMLMLPAACGRPGESSSGPGLEVERESRGLTSLSRTGWVVTASTTGSGTTLSGAIDGNAATRWGTGVATQVANQYLQVDMLALRTFTEVTLDTSGAPNDYPRTFKIEVADTLPTWRSVVASVTGSSPLVTVAFAPQTARYIKITLTNPTTPTIAATWSIYELNVFGTALSRTAWTATASPAGTGGSTAGQNALDGSTSTSWSSAGGQSGQLFTVDMSSPRTFNQITVDAGAGSTNYLRGYQVFVSNNNTDWATASPIATGTGTSAFLVINFATQEARWLRIKATTAGAPAWTIQELNVNGQPTVRTLLPTSNWTATTSNTAIVAKNAFDGNATTRWSTTSTGQSSSDFFQVDMGTFHTFTEVVLDAGTTSTEYPRKFDLKVSMDASTWTTVQSVTGTTALVTVTFAAQTARYIRIQSTVSPAISTKWSIQEMTVTGSSLSRSGWAISTGTSPSTTTDVAANALDGSLTTRWTTSANQASGNTFQVDLGVSQIFNQITLDAGTSTTNYPRAYSVSLSSDGTTWGAPVAAGTGTKPLITINFLTQPARFIRISQTATAGVTNPWSIQELNVWRLKQPCDAPCTTTLTCRAGVCDPSSGTCSIVTQPDGAVCDDGNACTMGEACQAGVCTTGPDSACTVGSNVTFYLSYDNGSSADIAGGPKAALGSPFVQGTGLFGAGLASATDPFLFYTDSGPTPDVSLTKPGSFSCWLKLDSTFALGAPIEIQDGHSFNSMYVVDGGPDGFGVDIYHDGMPGPFPVRSGVTASSWAGDGRWHLLVVNWTRTHVAISVDGAPQMTPVAVPWFVPGHVFGPGTSKSLFVGGGGVGTVKDEVLILNRPMTDADVQWYYNAARNGGPAGGNPAIAHFTASNSVACDTSDDLNPCSADSCVPVTGVGHMLLSGVSCDDGTACNGVAMCNNGSCEAGAPPAACPGAGPCRGPGTCDPATGACVSTHLPDGTACNDDNECTTGDSCQGGGCVGASQVTCPAPDPCHLAGTCNPSSGTCAYPVAAAGTGCSDGDACDGAEACDAYGVCRSGTPVVCAGSGGCADAPVCNASTGACVNPGGTDCTVADVGLFPDFPPLSPANVPDPSAVLESGCRSLRDVPVQFLDYRKTTELPGPFDDSSYIPNIIGQLNESFSKACIAFHERGHATILDTKFSTLGAQDFDWANPADRNSWPLAVPHNPTCPFVPPTTGKSAGRDALLAYILQVCPLNDEMTIVSVAGVSSGSSAFPTRDVNIQGSAVPAHEVGHNFSLSHPFAGVSWTTPTAMLQGRAQTAAEWWDFLYLPGSKEVGDKFYQTPAAVAADMTPGAAGVTPVVYFTFPGIHFAKTGAAIRLPSGPPLLWNLPLYTSPDPAVATCDNPLPPPPLVSTPCSQLTNAELDARVSSGDFRCYMCEYRRMYDAYCDPQKPPLPPYCDPVKVPLPPPSAAPFAFFLAPGQGLAEWRGSHMFRDGFRGFYFEKIPSATTPGELDPIRSLAPTKTKLQVNNDAANMAIRFTTNAMYYEETFPPFRSLWAPAFSDSQVALIKRATSYDYETTGVTGSPTPLNPPSFGHRPAYGSWEKIAQYVSTSHPGPSIVAARGGAFMTVKTDNGNLAYRYWTYANPPWSNKGLSLFAPSSPGWKTLAVDPSIAATTKFSSVFFPGATSAADRLALVVDQAAAGPLQALVTPDGGISGWTAEGSSPISAAPVLYRRSDGTEHLGVLTLSSTGAPLMERYTAREWNQASKTWSDPQLLPFLFQAMADGLDASVRPDGTVDLVARTYDTRLYRATLSPAASNWTDMGLPPVPSAYAPTVSSGAPPGQPSATRTDYFATDTAGSVWYKAHDIASDVWTPNSSGWTSLGGTHFGRVNATRNDRGELDLVTRDFDRHTVRFKRLRAGGQWSPTQASTWFDLGGQGFNDPVAIQRPGAPDVVDVFSVDWYGSMWHRAFVVPPYVSDPWKQQYEIDYNTYCCATPGNPACPCTP